VAVLDLRASCRSNELLADIIRHGFIYLVSGIEQFIYSSLPYKVYLVCHNCVSLWKIVANCVSQVDSNWCDYRVEHSVILYY